MRIRVVSIISRMNIGGPAVLLSELINNLPETDYEHILITGACEENETDFLESHSLLGRIIYLNSIKRSIFIFSDFAAFLRLIILLRRIRPDVVHTHTTKAGFLGRLAARLAVPKACVIHTYHGHLLYGYFPWSLAKLVVVSERLLTRFTDVCIAVSKQIKLDLVEVGVGLHSKWTVIHPGVNLRVSQQRSIESHSASSHPGQFKVCWIGRFTEIKNPLLAIKAIEILHESKRVHLFMAGEGELLENCRSYSEERGLPITFLGWVDPISDLMLTADILLLSSKNEGMPVVIVEAANLGLATLATNVGGVHDFIIHNKTGYLVNQEAQEIADLLLTIINNPDNLAETSNRALELSRKEYSEVVFVQKHMQLYQELTSNA